MNVTEAEDAANAYQTAILFLTAHVLITFCSRSIYVDARTRNTGVHTFIHIHIFGRHMKCTLECFEVWHIIKSLFNIVLVPEEHP